VGGGVGGWGGWGWGKVGGGGGGGVRGSRGGLGKRRKKTSITRTDLPVINRELLKALQKIERKGVVCTVRSQSPLCEVGCAGKNKMKSSPYFLENWKHGREQP